MRNTDERAMPEDDGRINGVNLGGWLVLERWMTPGLFRASGEEDEIWLHRSTDPAELERLLTEQSALEAQLADPEIYADHARSSELLKTFEACKKRGEDLFEEMTALEERMDAVRGRWNTED